VWINYEDAREIGVEDNDWVEVVNRNDVFLIDLKISVAKVLGAYFLSALANTFLATGLYMYMAEVFPAGARSMGGALTDGLGHLSRRSRYPWPSPYSPPTRYSGHSRSWRCSHSLLRLSWRRG